MDNKDINRVSRPSEQNRYLLYLDGYRIIDCPGPRPDSETNRDERPTPSRDFREKRHGQ